MSGLNESLREIIARGKRDRRIPAAQITDILEKLDYDAGQIDALYEALDGSFEISADAEETGAAEISGLDIYKDVPDWEPMMAYLKEIESVSPITPEEEESLAAGMAEGDQVARRRLAEAGIRISAVQADRFAGKGLEALDLIQEGNLGLIRAIEKYDSSRGVPFSVLALWWIRQSMSAAVTEKAQAVRVPLHRSELYGMLKRASDRLKRENGREPSAEEAAQAAGVSAEKARELFIRRDGDLPEILEEAAEESAEEPEQVEKTARDIERERQSLLRERLRDVIDTLTPRESRILKLRYGMNGGGEMEPEEVARELGISEEKVRLAEAKAVRKLHHPSGGKRLRDYLE